MFTRRKLLFLGFVGAIVMIGIIFAHGDLVGGGAKALPAVFEAHDMPSSGDVAEGVDSYGQGCSTLPTTVQPESLGGCLVASESLPSDNPNPGSDASRAEMLLSLRPRLLANDFESAAIVLSFSGDCPPGPVAAALENRACALATDMAALAAEVLETGVRQGDPSAQFFMANWTFAKLVRGEVPLSAAGSPATPSSELQHAEDLLKRAADAGNIQAIEFIEMRKRFAERRAAAN